MKNERNNSEKRGEPFVVSNSILKEYKGGEEYLRLPGFIYAVGKSAFAGNDTIKTVSLSSNATVIGDNAFDGCSSLEEVIFPYEITSIGKHAFKGCASLLQIVFNGNKERWLAIKKGEGWIDGTNDFVIICKDAELTKQDEIDIESEPALNFDLTKIKVDLQSKGGRSPKKNEAEQDNDADKKPVIIDAPDWSPENRQAYLERRRRELIERMQMEMDDDADDEDEEAQGQSDSIEERIKFNADNFQVLAQEVEDNGGYDDIDDIRYKALKFCAKKGYASVSLIQRSFPIGFNQSCKIFDWMITEGFIKNSGKNTCYRVTITEEELNAIIKERTTESAKEISAFKKLLEKLTLNKKDSVKQLAIVLNCIAEKKQHEEFAIEEPSHSLWNDEEEFDATVMDRLERLVRSDLKMARRGAIKKAETYLYAVHDTNDGKMAQVYERVVYELKITSDGLYNQIRNSIREE